MKRILESQEGSPRLAKQVHCAEIERFAHGLDLGHETRHPPDRLIIRFVRSPRPQLVVTYNPKPLASEIEKWLQVFAITAWPSMEEEERAISFAGALVPDSAFSDLDVTCMPGRRN